MSETYAGEKTAVGGVLIMAISALAAVLVIAGLAYAVGTGGRHQAALAAAGCEPNLSPSGLPCTTYPALISEFRAMVTPATQQLSTDAAAYAASENQHLAPAESALNAMVETERALGSTLASFPFPPAAVPAAKALEGADQALAAVTAEQARSSSLPQLRSFDDRVDAAKAAVQTKMNLLRKALAVPPATSQEP
jgi:hypothetical protein